MELGEAAGGLPRSWWLGRALFALRRAVQSAGKGSLAGKLTDLHSVPLGGVAVVLRNQGTGAEARTTTEKNGSYRFTGLGPGEYTLEAESSALGRGQVGGIFVSEGHESRVQAALRLDPLPPQPVEAAKPIRAVLPVAEAGPTFVAVTGPAAQPDKPAMEASVPAVQPSVPAVRPLPDPRREMPETVSATAEAELDFESIQQLHLGGRQVPEMVREKPRTEVVALNVHLADVAMRTLPLSDGAGLLLLRRPFLRMRRMHSRLQTRCSIQT